MLQYSQISAQQLQRNRSESEDKRGAQADKKPAVDEEQQLENLLGNEKINVSLLPVYQCMHVYDALGQLEKFESYYTENRKLQADLVMTASFTLGSGNLKALEEFLADILGFFVVEGIVTSTTESTYLKSALVRSLIINILTFMLFFFRWLPGGRSVGYRCNADKKPPCQAGL